MRQRVGIMRARYHTKPGEVGNVPANAKMYHPYQKTRRGAVNGHRRVVKRQAVVTNGRYNRDNVAQSGRSVERAVNGRTGKCSPAVRHGTRIAKKNRR